MAVPNEMPASPTTSSANEEVRTTSLTGIPQARRDGLPFPLESSCSGMPSIGCEWFGGLKRVVVAGTSPASSSTIASTRSAPRQPRPTTRAAIGRTMTPARPPPIVIRAKARARRRSNHVVTDAIPTGPPTLLAPTEIRTIAT